ncbi:Protein of unknown function [Austwickia chelonae]|uniref:Glycosyltransferase n=1 Tax=Austwickia chelonae NBRC 105200 TaxID=1184607 RepID=K6W9L8_9MICO|nr:glycosyltransferase family 87 protein [Austwickia chelonae]GAB78507.1 hypothetical protein AUCHE_09_01120 [Austwickia chelonae NBRC 105200]SEW40234.1 Protein of unknown function [Austwickia chelonae]
MEISRGRRVLVLLATAALLLLAARALTTTERWMLHYDLDIYLNVARSFLDTGSLYSYRTDTGMGFTYPPVAIVFFLPFVSLPPTTAWVFWNLLIVAATVPTAWLWAREVRASVSTREFRMSAPAGFTGVVVVALVLASEPVTRSLWLGQVSPFVGVATVAGLVGVQARRGAWTGLGAAAKLTPGANLAAYLAFAHLRPRIVPAVVTGVVLTGLGVLIAPASSWEYFGTLVWDSSRVGRVDLATNESLAGVFARWGVPAPVATKVGLFTAVVLAVGWFLAVRRHRPGPVEVVGAVGVTMLFALPIGWSHHALPVVFAWVGLFVIGVFDRGPRWWLLPGCAVAGLAVWTVPVVYWTMRWIPQVMAAAPYVRPVSSLVLLAVTVWTARSRSTLPAGSDLAVPGR